MNITNSYCVNNDCYKANKKLTRIDYLIVHTPGVYPVIIRAASGTNNWFKRWNKPKVEKLTHGFIDDTGVYNFAPLDMRCWHVGNTVGNSTCIGYEICELEDIEAFNKAWDNATSYYAQLCIKFNLTSDKVIGHCEAHKLGVASNHSDPATYFKRYGKTMDDFRADVAAKIKSLTTKKGTVVNCRALNIRQTPNGPKIIAVVAAGTVLDIMGTDKDSDGDEWYEVAYKNMIGYVWPKYVKVV